MHLPTVSLAVRNPRMPMDHQLARATSIVSPIFNNSWFWISTKPRTNNVKRGDIPVFPEITSEDADDEV